MAQQRSDLGLPAWLIFLRIAQGALALLILILSAVAAAKYLGGADPTYLVTPFPGFGFCWFAFAWTAVYLPLAVFLFPRFSPNAKPVILLFVLDALSTLWWLVTFALLADHSAKIGLLLDVSSTGSFADDLTVALDLTRTIAALGAGEL
ncbi:uncharacterized protein A1O9_09952 [Exophiala aquamarina CBS 119918]|uniref:MARVEL domain-containing protein n=1 Tax=Exophiala aquamarina CBS 119918 TaxID=1182545 RepID=A0A072P374_9EURO|nr:uncharacterized protein A1O9_09952 [Exophiala aquamarina CBS 119918]KEF54157.1 hypothetical protein A1O9_09952 [Exophiala aquamarina CBS 119918]